MQIFEGNTHYDTPELRHFEETVAQYVRLYPERWSPAGIGMRVEILGCDLPGRAFCWLFFLYIYMIICRPGTDSRLKNLPPRAVM